MIKSLANQCLFLLENRIKRYLGKAKTPEILSVLPETDEYVMILDERVYRVCRENGMLSRARVIYNDDGEAIADDWYQIAEADVNIFKFLTSWYVLVTSQDKTCYLLFPYRGKKMELDLQGITICDTLIGEGA